MAVTVGTVKNAFAFTESIGPGLALDSSADKMLECRVTVQFDAGTYAQADGSSFSPATVIQNTRRNGKTVTVRRAAFVSAGDENGTTVTGGDTTVSTSVVSLHLYGSDQTTEHSNAALSATWNRPLTFAVSFTESIA
jgi:hypothetical protein